MTLVLALLTAGTAVPCAAALARLPVARGATATDVVIPIRLDAADGVNAMDFTFDYDASVAVPTGAYRTTYTSSYSVSASFATPGRVALSVSAGNPLTGSGEVAWIAFRVTGASGQTGLTWFSCALNGGALPCSTQNGSLQVGTAASLVRIPDDAGSGPATTAVVPVSATSVDGVAAIDLTLTYNAAVLTATSVAKTSLTAGMVLTYNLGTPGEVRATLFTSGTPLAGSGDILTVTFTVAGALGDATPLNLTRALFNEGTISTLLDDVLFRVCDATDADGDGLSACGGDCNNGNATVRPGLPELCDGLDNDCNGFTDDVAAPGNSAALAVGRSGVDAHLSWPAFAGASGYDVVRGSLELLRPGGDFAGATDACLADDTAVRALDDAALPGAGDGFWYAVRGVSCGIDGSYDDPAGAGQVASRDPGIAAAPSACP
jgi:hypothetical protein